MWIEEKQSNRGYVFRGEINCGRPKSLEWLNKRKSDDTWICFSRARNDMIREGFSYEKVRVTIDKLVGRRKKVRFAIPPVG